MIIIFYQKKKFNLKITDFSTNMIDLNYEKQNKMSNCITNNLSKLKHISILQIINHNISNKINNNN